jgi:bacterioferritin
MKLFESLVDEEQIHFNYFQNVDEHIKKLGPSYLAQIAGTPADSGPPSKGFVTGQAQ